MDRRTFIKLVTYLGVSFAIDPAGILPKAGSCQELETKVQEGNPISLDSAYNYSNTDLAKYHSWIDKTIAESKQNDDYALIIDKSQYTLNIIKNGEFHSKYNIELGPNPIDDKKIEGDGCTPEGMYHIVNMKDEGQTRYHKALLINYPNSDDKKKFKHLKDSGQILPTDTIGGLIEIHGMGTGYKGNGKGQNWTLGCIALSNADIDEVFDVVSKNSRVTIVKYGTKY